MRYTPRVITLLLINMLLTACAVTDKQPSNVSLPLESSGSSVAVNPNLTVASWNMEHFAYPLSDGCRPRTNTELMALREYADGIKADIIALQEVASVKAIEQLFPAEQWQILLSERPDSESYECRKTGFRSTQQKVAFVVSKEIEIKNVRSIKRFALDRPGLRYGLELTVATDLGPIALLNVHMKSGCFVDNYQRADSESCQTFAKQTPLLIEWLATQQQNKQPYLVLGDFNHRLSAPYNQLTQQVRQTQVDTFWQPSITTDSLIGCHPYYPAPIDHIIAGGLMTSNTTQKVTFHRFQNMEPKEMLSDHCAVSLTLVREPLPLTNAVTWQTSSKEYRYLTETAYQQAATRVANLELPNNPWVVVMDVDETVLDNSQYQVVLDQTGASYSSASWANWVKSEQATLVPGVKAFIASVLERGGHIALVTNRSRDLDRHTWNNLVSVGLPVTPENTCLLGRSPADKQAVGNEGIKNDKDLRRQQIADGSASCYHSDGERAPIKAAHTIMMQVGDNIEDFAGVTQESADVLMLVQSSNGRLVLLPNPMYGSWQ